MLIKALLAAALVGLIGRRVIALLAIGVVLGVMFDAIAQFQTRWLRIAHGIAVVFAAAAFLAATIAALLVLALPLIEEGTHLVDTMARQAGALSRTLERDAPWLLPYFPILDHRPAPANDMPKATAARDSVRSGAALVGGLADALAVFFLGIFLAWDPRRWMRGIAVLLPFGALERRVALMDAVVCALRSYLFTLAIYVIAMGCLWTLGLWLIGVQYPVVFGVIGGVAEIVPYFGPLVALIPPLLFSVTLGTSTVLWLLLLYIALHIVEGYLLVPYVLHHREHLPPPLVVISILVCGAVFGTLGLIIALPVGLVCYVLARELPYRPPSRPASS